MLELLTNSFVFHIINLDSDMLESVSIDWMEQYLYTYQLFYENNEEFDQCCSYGDKRVQHYCKYIIVGPSQMVVIEELFQPSTKLYQSSPVHYKSPTDLNNNELFLTNH